jgi:hypothetical protein
MYYQAKRRRELSGGRELWAGMIPGYGWAQLVAGWFSASVETFLRRGMGERFYSRGNFTVGALVLGGFTLFSMFRAAATRAGVWDFGLFVLLFGAYLVLGSFHLARNVYLRNTGQAEHSMTPGTSRLLPLATLFLWACNAVARPVFGVVMRALPKRQRRGAEDVFPIFRDEEAITVLAIEPLACFVLALLAWGPLNLPLVGAWLALSTGALWVHSSLYWEAQMQQFLDLQDSFIEAEYLPAALAGAPRAETRGVPVLEPTRQLVTQAADAMKNKPQVWARVQESRPEMASGLSDAVARLHPDLQALIAGSSPAGTEATRTDAVPPAPPAPPAPPPTIDPDPDPRSIDPDEPWSTYKPPG